MLDLRGINIYCISTQFINYRKPNLNNQSKARNICHKKYFVFGLRYNIWNSMLTIRTMDDVCMLILIILTKGTFSLETVTIVDLSLRVVSIVINTLICITIVVQTRYTSYIRSLHFSCNLLWADEHYGMVFKSLKCRKRLGYISTDCPMSNSF